MSVGTTPGKGRVECLICGDDVKTAGKDVRKCATPNNVSVGA